jgi:hypothetical protein
MHIHSTLYTIHTTLYNLHSTLYTIPATHHPTRADKRRISIQQVARTDRQSYSGKIKALTGSHEPPAARISSSIFRNEYTQ